jgi:hypothetical protein
MRRWPGVRHSGEASDRRRGQFNIGGNIGDTDGHMDERMDEHTDDSLA